MHILELLKQVGSIAKDIPDVKVFEVLHRVKQEEEWIKIFEDNDVVIAHPNSISPYYKNLYPIPPSLIDLILVDEAHHEPAPTWSAINEFYRDTRRIFLLQHH